MCETAMTNPENTRLFHYTIEGIRDLSRDKIYYLQIFWISDSHKNLQELAKTKQANIIHYSWRVLRTIRKMLRSGNTNIS